MKRILGYLILLLLAAGFFVLITWQDGWIVALVTFVLTAAFMGLVWLAAWLVYS